MRTYVGIDEVGYGPKLGPLIVCGVCFISDKIKRVAKKINAMVCDSKKLYSPKRGLQELENTALSFMKALLKNKLNIKNVITRFCICDQSKLLSLPWYKNLTLPVSQNIDRINRNSEIIKKEGIKFNIFLDIIEAERFNKGVMHFCSKLDYLSNVVMNVVKACAGSFICSNYRIFVGKQGARTYYLEGLRKYFPEGKIKKIAEKKDSSKYRIYLNKSRLDVNFLLNGEDKSFFIALSSIIGKYIREIFMKNFNSYWTQKIPGINYTSGYMPECKNFIKKLRPYIKKHNIPESLIIRVK
jgi:ribonuclease HII